MEAATTSQARPKTADGPGSSRGLPPSAQARNPTSPEVISNLIFSLSSISDESEQLLDGLLPAQESVIRTPSRSSRRPQPSYAPNVNKEAPPPVPTLMRETFSAVEQSRPEPILDIASSSSSAAATRLPAVREVASPTKSTNSSSAIATNRPRVAVQPAPISIPRRSISLSTSQMVPAGPGFGESGGGTRGETFASISITPGKSNSESLTSADSSAKRPGAVGMTSTKAKSTKDRIREMDAERKKRRSRAAKTTGANNKPIQPQRSAGAKGVSPLPSPGFAGDDNLPSPMRNGFLAVPPSPRLAARNKSGSVTGETTPEEENGSFPFAGSSKHGDARPGVAGKGMFIPPRNSSARASLEIPARSSSRASSPTQSRAGSRARKRGDASRSALDRNEADTNRRIEELQRAKAERKIKEEELMARLQEPPRSVLGDIMPNGGVTKLDAEMPEPKGRKKSMDQSRRGARSAMSHAGSDSKQHLAPNFTARAREHDIWSTVDTIDEAVEDYVSDPRLSQVIYHPQTKRAISYSDVGDPNGAVIICCIGMGTTRFVTALFEELAMSLGLRLITPERPGIGASEPYGPMEMDTPLGWPDDVRLICTHLNIKRFMVLAHSAGAVYALATALRMPSEIRGRVHLLAPWIPPSQLMSIGLNDEPVPVAELPLIQRILRSIPDSLLEAATRIFNVSSITSSLGKSPHAKKRRRNTTGAADRKRGETPGPQMLQQGGDDREEDGNGGDDDDDDAAAGVAADPRSTASSPVPQTEGMNGAAAKGKRDSRPNEPQAKRTSSQMDMNAARFDEALEELTEEEKKQEYGARLLAEIWRLATTGANPAIDLTVCLERKQEIGFRYEDITKPVVMQHGSKDTRVPVDNIRWIGEKMRRCEVRILEGEGHGLMGSGTVMANVLTEMQQDWEDWNALTRHKRGQN